MFKQILLPLDRSSLAECVLPHALAIGRVFGSRLTLLHVLDKYRAYDDIIDPLDWHLRKIEAQAYLGQFGHWLSPAGFVMDNVLLEGPAAEQVIEYAQEQQTDLIILSSHGRSGLSNWNVSSVAQKIVARAPAAVMLVRAYRSSTEPANATHYRRILVALDGSPRAEAILPVAHRLASEHEAQLVLVHIVARPAVFYAPSLSSEEQRLIERLTAGSLSRATDYFERLLHHLPADTAVRLRASDDVVTTLLRTVEEEDADLVLLSAHGLSCDPHRPHGHIVSSLITHSASPVLVMQDLPPQEQMPGYAELAAKSDVGGRAINYADSIAMIPT